MSYKSERNIHKPKQTSLTKNYTLQSLAILSSSRFRSLKGTKRRYLELKALNLIRWGRPPAIRLTVSSICRALTCLITENRSKYPLCSISFILKAKQLLINCYESQMTYFNTAHKMGPSMNKSTQKIV